MWRTGRVVFSGAQRSCWTLAWTALAWMMFAQTTGAAAENGREIVDFLPRTADREGFVRAVTRQTGSPATLAESSDDLVEAIRWMTESSGISNCTETRDVVIALLEKEGRGATSLDLFAGLLRVADREIILVRSEEAIETLKLAMAFLPCVDVVLSRDHVRTLFLHNGVANLFLEKGQHEQAFRDLLAVDPRFRFDPAYPPAVLEAFLKVVQEQAGRQGMPVDAEEQADSLFLDGLVSSSLTEVFAGRHVLQLEGPFGAVRTALVTIPQHGNGPIFLSRMTDFGLPDPVEVKSALIRSLRNRLLEPAQTTGLDRYLEHMGIDALWFAVVGPETGEPELRVYHRGTGLEPARVDTQVVSRPESHVQLALGLGLRLTGGSPDAFAMTQRAGGYQLEAGMTRGRLWIAALLSLYPYYMVSFQADGSCGAIGPGQILTDAQVEAALACQETRVTAGGGIGVGYRLELGDRLVVTPAVFADVVRVPNVLVFEQAGPAGGVLVADTVMAGPVGRAIVEYRLLPRAAIDGRLELFGGATATRVEETLVLAVPFGIVLGVGAAF